MQPLKHHPDYYQALGNLTVQVGALITDLPTDRRRLTRVAVGWRHALQNFRYQVLDAFPVLLPRLSRGWDHTFQ